MTREISNPLEQLTLDQLRTRTSMKWRAFDPDVLPLWVAEMDVPLAEPIAKALTDLVARGDTGYPAGTAYAEALAAFAADRWDWDGLAVGRTTIVPDVMMGIVEVLRLVTEPGEQVIVNNPVYPPFYSFVEHMDRRILEAPVGPDGRLDLEVVEGAMEQATAGGAGAAYLLCNPHNPLGTVHTRAELEAVAAMAERHGVRVVADEIHGPLVLPGAQFVPYLSVEGAQRGFSLMSASKGWNLAGLKAALAVAGPGAAADLARMPEEVSHGPSHVGVVAHTAALRDGGPWLDGLLAGLDANRGLLGDLLAKHLPMIGFRPPQATFLAWLDCGALGLAEDGDGGRGNVMTRSGPAAFFTEHARVALNAGTPFGTGGAGHCRLNFGTSQAILTQAVQRMGEAAAEV